MSFPLPSAVFVLLMVPRGPTRTRSSPEAPRGGGSPSGEPLSPLFLAPMPSLTPLASPNAAPMSESAIAELKGRAARLMEENESVTRALKRLGGGASRKPGAVAAALAAALLPP